MLAQRRPDEQVYVGPTSVSNVGPTESTNEKLRWPNVVMLSGTCPSTNYKTSMSQFCFLLCCKLVSFSSGCLGKVLLKNVSCSETSSITSKIFKKLYLLSPRLCFFILLKRDLFVYRGDSLAS